MICPLAPPWMNKDCRHCSDETTHKVQHVGVIKTGLIERRQTRIHRGLFCNNDGRHFVKELTVCPQPVPGSIPLVTYEVSELEWMRRRVQK
jgi:hypothetical protein